MRTPIGVVVAAVLLSALAAIALAADSTEEFVRRHWRQPIPPQGPAPARFTALEASLHPEACGTCHVAQYADWRTSLHAAAMGPGVAGQLVEMAESDPAGATGCYACHGPVAEQSPLVRAPRGRADAPAGFTVNPAFDPVLRGKGVVCAGCHVRSHERFGPPRRDGSLTSPAPRESLPHAGATRTPAFLAAEFCRGCHQFGPDGPSLGGKLLQDTYAEWKASRFAREGVQCQDCHMPDRRHLWRGIHDPDMVRSGLTIAAGAEAPRYRPGDTATVTLAVESTRVGHAFPTYVTPRVVLRAELLDAGGTVVPGSREEQVIAREIELDLSREFSDTRLWPGQRAELRYRRRLDAEGQRVRVSVVVEPDAFYARFFEVLLAQGAGRGAAQIREALAAARRSPFTVFVQEIALDRGAPRPTPPGPRRRRGGRSRP
jgi:hypothetical protein